MESAEKHFWLGREHYAARRIREAREHYFRALQLGIDPERDAQQRWMCMMLLGEFAAAWQESDRVLQERADRGLTCSHEPLHCRWLWDGTPIRGKRLLIRCYHGLGDTIQFIRYAPLLKRICPEVTVQAQTELLPLLETAAGIDLLVPLKSEPPEHEVEIELMEAPHILRTTIETIPNGVPYLMAGGVAPSPSPFRVGLVWAAGAWKPERSVPLDKFRFLNELPHIAVVSLQVGDATSEISAAGVNFTDFLAEGPITSLAQKMAGLDLIITVDTMAAHLAGALGRPVWTLLHHAADWRWMVDRDDSPWYPTMRLFRQPTPGDWDAVMDAISTRLRSLGSLQETVGSRVRR